jgi:hypothetical protein
MLAWNARTWQSMGGKQVFSMRGSSMVYYYGRLPKNGLSRLCVKKTTDYVEGYG